MQEVVYHRTKGRRLRPSEEQLNSLEVWLQTELTAAKSSRSTLEKVWRESLRQYEGVPRNPAKSYPVENASNIEVTLGAIASDALYAQIIDLIFGISPLITVRAVGKGDSPASSYYVEMAKALQRFVNWLAGNEVDLKPAVNDFALDDVQLGTAVYYIPFREETVKKAATSVKKRGPVVRSVPIEDVFIIGSSHRRVQDLRGVALRFWQTAEELRLEAKRNNWQYSDRLESIIPDTSRDWVRSSRERLGMQQKPKDDALHLYAKLEIYAKYDIDGDGLNEDLFIVYDWGSGKVLNVDYGPYDHWPVEVGCYQARAHLFYGIGVLQMLMGYEEELTNLHNYQVDNSYLANCRFYVGPPDMDGHRIWPGRLLGMSDPSKFATFAMADTYPSLDRLQLSVLQLAQQRVGLNELSSPGAVGAGTARSFGNRTPTGTTMAMLQAVNKRFTPAFDGIRMATARALKQCLYRYQERVLAGDTKAMAHISRVLGPQDGMRVIQVLRDETFDEHLEFELTAASVSTNKEADRQNAMMLVNILANYYQRVLELVQISSSSQTSDAVREVAVRIANSAGELIERTIRTFDQVRDPQSFIIEMEDVLDQAAGEAQDKAFQQLMGLVPASAEAGAGSGGRGGRGEQRPTSGSARGRGSQEGIAEVGGIVNMLSALGSEPNQGGGAT